MKTDQYLDFELRFHGGFVCFISKKVVVSAEMLVKMDHVKNEKTNETQWFGK